MVTGQWDWLLMAPVNDDVLPLPGEIFLPLDASHDIIHNQTIVF